MKRRESLILTKQRGFTLIELLIVITILGLVIGAVFSQMSLAQQRMSTEEIKLDDFQQARDFIDQFFRDINEIGYPNTRMVDTNPLDTTYWNPALVTQSGCPTSCYYSYASPYINDNRFAIGLVKIDVNMIQFEADTNGDGNVQSVIYEINGSGNTGGQACTWCLQRSQVAKVTGDPINGQIPNWGTEVNDVISNPIFKYFRADGTQVTGLPLDYTTQAGAQALAQIKTIQFSLTIRNNAVMDQKTGQPIETNIAGEISLNNCSMAAFLQPMSC